ncbi:hypothetical protein DERP_000888 [Dermatophagoides pteronyssinus]|uniref:Uncharacterized protein n=1 Tax=Dermatophagoides pteronyssinus TaxID=6956 RepID=A0ABQ8JDG2_DERPT|nr:hypothetical protein DERP_000888 [Dermatophagoides pteronyssinus]
MIIIRIFIFTNYHLRHIYCPIYIGPFGNQNFVFCPVLSIRSFRNRGNRENHVPTLIVCTRISSSNKH